MIVIDLSSPEGNVFYLMGLVNQLLKQKGHSEVFIKEVMDDMQSSDYIHALNVFESHLGIFIKFINDPRQK